MKSILALSIIITLASCRPEEPAFKVGRVVDLSYAYDSTTIYWQLVVATSVAAQRNCVEVLSTSGRLKSSLRTD